MFGNTHSTPGSSRGATMRTNESRANLFLVGLATLGMLALGTIPLARSQPVPSESVEELRLLLKAPVTELTRREQVVREQLKLLDGINDWRRALALGEWRDDDPDERVAA